MQTPELAVDLDDMKAQSHDLAIHALLTLGPAVLAIGAWLGVRNQVRRLEAERAALVKAPGPVIDADSRPVEDEPPPADE